MNQDIVIRLQGTSANVMERKAGALERLATSIATINRIAGASLFTGATRGANQYATAVQRAGVRTDRFGTVIRGGGNALDNFGTLFARMVRIMGAYFIIATVTALTRDFLAVMVTAPARMELWNVQLTTLVGNATLAATRLRLLQDVAIETPLGLADLFEGLVTLQAFNVEISERTLPLVADLAAVSGRSFEQVAQVIGKVIQGSQPAITRSLPVLGINPQEFRALERELGNRADAIFQIIEERFGGFAKRSSDTTLGVFEKIKDSFFVIMATVGEGILPVLRDRAEEFFEALESLRNSPDALDKLRVSFFEMARGVERAALFIVQMAEGVKRLTDEFGGLLRILQALAAVWIIRFAVGVAQAVANMNPWVAGITAAVAGLLFLSERLGLFDDTQEQAAAKQALFADQLERTNRALAENASLVDATTRAAQGRTVGLEAIRLQGALSGDISLNRVAQILGEIQPLLGLAQQGRDVFGRLALEEFREASGRARLAQQAGQVDRSREAFAEAVAAARRVQEILQTEAAVILGQAEELKKAAEGAIVPPSTGEGGEETIEDLFRKRDAFLKAMEEFDRDLIAAQRQFISRPVEIAEAQLAAGIGDTASLLGLIDRQITDARTLLQAELRRVLEGDENQVAASVDMALAIHAEITNLEGLKAQIIKGLEDPLTQAAETVIRQAFQRAGDIIGEAIGEAIAGVGDVSFFDAIKRTFAAFLNLFGDMLIQAGTAKEVFDGLVRAIIGLIPGGGAAAIAAGIALKAAASALTAGVGASANTPRSFSSGSVPTGGTFTPGGGAGGFAEFPTFQASQSSGAVRYEIYAMDAKSFKEFAERNVHGLAAGVKRIVQGDRATRGQEFGVFSAGVLKGA